MGDVISDLIDTEIDKIEDAHLRRVLKLLREYSEIQAGTWKTLMDKRERAARREQADS